MSFAEFLKQASEVITVRPGQTLVIRYDRDVRITPAEAASIEAELAEMLPGIPVILIRCDQLAVVDSNAHTELLVCDPKDGGTT